MSTYNFVRTDAQTTRFINNYRLLIYKACADKKLKRCDWDIVLNNVAIKYAQGRLVYVPQRGASKTTFIYAVAKNAVRDLLRGMGPGLDTGDDDEIDKYKDGRDAFASIYEAGDSLIVKEALRRLAKETKDKMKIELLVRYVLNEEEREQLANEYGVENDFVSLVKTRYLPKLQAITLAVMREDERGKLVLGDASEIKFLKPYMKW